MKLATFDEKGFPTGFYPDDASQEVPEDATPITDEQWAALLENSGRAYWDGADVAIYTPPPPTPEEQLALMSSVSRPQMLAALVDFEIITEAEAVGWLGGELPVLVQEAIDSLPPAMRLVATLRAKAQTPVDPSDAIVAALAAFKEMGTEAIIELFAHAASL